MPRKAAFPPKPHPHHASGQERVRYRGKDYYLGPIGSVQAQQRYAQLLQHWTASKAAPPKTKPPAMLTVGEVWTAFLAHAGATMDQREINAFGWCRDATCAKYGGLPAVQFDSLCLIEVQRYMAVERRWCRRVVNRMIVRVRTCWRWAETRRLVPAGIWQHLRSVPGLGKNDRGVRHSPPRRVPTFAEVKAVARRCRRPLGLALLLQWWTGMRSCEVRMMRPCDLDRSGDVWFYRPAGHKGDWREGDTGRVVPLGPKSQAVLRPLLGSTASAAYFFCPSRRGKLRRLGHYTACTYAQAVHRAAKVAGLDWFQPYGCRHAAKERFKRLFGLDAARAMLGQLSLGTTNDYGSQLDLEAAAKVAKRSA